MHRTAARRVKAAINSQRFIVQCLPLMMGNSQLLIVNAGSTGNGEGAAGKRGTKRGHQAQTKDSDSDRDGSDNYVPGSQTAAAAAVAKAKK